MKSKTAARVAVAYFGSKGDVLLPLPRGSALVVDATIDTLAAGSTCPTALDRLRKKGVEIYSAQYLHAKAYAFDKVAFIGSANASRRSERTLIEAVLRVDDRNAILSVRNFVESLCLTQLTREDLVELSQYYRPPRFRSSDVNQAKYSTLLMELTYEQGLGRMTQVQPPKAVWEHYFRVKLDAERLPTLSLIDESLRAPSVVKRAVVKHHHNYTIELAGAGPPRPAILQMRRVARNSYSYRVHRPKDRTFSKIDELVRTLPNPLWEPGRRWILI